MRELKILTSTDRGREFIVEATIEGRKLNGVVPRELLDDELGDNSSTNLRENWIQRNRQSVIDAMLAKADGGICTAPFDRIAYNGEG